MLKTLLVILFLLLLNNPVLAVRMTLTTDGGFLIKISSTSQLGQMLELSPLKIFPSDSDRVFEVYKVKSSELKKSEEGFEDMPFSWLIIKSTEVVIPANETGKIFISLKIPDEKEFYGGDYHISLCIRLKPNLGEFFSLASFPRIKITIPDFEEEIEADNNSDNSFNNHSSTDTNTPD